MKRNSLKCCCGFTTNTMELWKAHLERKKCLEYVAPLDLELLQLNLEVTMSSSRYEAVDINIQELADDKVKANVELRLAASVSEVEVHMSLAATEQKIPHCP